jgi:predicted ArsR family transcriptional regulator
MRQKVMVEIDEHGPGAATQLASRMSKPVTSIRPRLTELAMDGAIQDTGNRHKLPGGTSEIVWAAV